MNWPSCTISPKTKKTFCTSCYPRKCAPGLLGTVRRDCCCRWRSYAGRLPGHTYISCHFGEVDAFGNAGHRGTDIPAPEGTPILAAHSGTVLVSGWNDSYGNQVLLDSAQGFPPAMPT
mgnify:CR=1 FL=1